MRYWFRKLPLCQSFYKPESKNHIVEDVRHFSGSEKVTFCHRGCKETIKEIDPQIDYINTGKTVKALTE
jgi:hypothetical protein